ncbi:MAG: hypothetical protein JOZ03_06445 [Gammaproteobacteria bacterium]|nr:hypothetical protein [Gammaproteobacteria bacterium]
MRLSVPGAALAALLAAAPALAERDPQSGAPLPPQPRDPGSPITDHFFIRGTYYAPQLRTNLRVDPSNPPPGVSGTPVNGESDLGLAQRLHRGRVEFMFRLRDRNRVRVDFLEVDRSASKTIARDIVFNNETFAAGQVVQSSLDWRQFDITYTYSFIRNRRFELGSGVALYFLEVDAIGAVPAQRQRQEVSAATPFPALPLDATWRLSSRWAVTARAAYLKATVSGFRGWYADQHEDLQYRCNPHFVLGLGYSSTRSSLTRRGGSFPGSANVSISGPEAFIRFSY